MSERKMKTVAVLITLITILVIGTISYAFFITSVNNTNKETVTAGSAKISLVFDDNDNGISATLNPGESIVKKFQDALAKTEYRVACGIAEYKPGDDINETISLCDERMYSNKVKIKNTENFKKI